MRYVLHPNTKILGCTAAEQYNKGPQGNKVPQFEEGTGRPLVNFTVVVLDVGPRGPESSEFKIRVPHVDVPHVEPGELVAIQVGGEIIGRPWDMGDNYGVTWTADTVVLGPKPSEARATAPAPNGKEAVKS